MSKKLKLLTISDHPLSPSGVGSQTKYMCEALLRTGKYQIFSLGGALQHADTRMMKFQEWGDDWIIQPVQAYGNQEIVRSFVRNFRPDILWFMTDPRFYIWLWEIENEIRAVCPMLYYHVWDNYPYPTFNKVFYKSTDVVASISKVTSDIVRTVSPTTDETYFPHSIDTNIFKRLPAEQIAALKKENFSFHDGKMMFFWNSRNARRKQSGTLIWRFKEFLDIVGHDKAFLLMKTDPKDENGQDLDAIIYELGLHKNRSVLIHNAVTSPQELAAIYNMADATVSVSDAEGMGLSTMESLACEKPIIVTMTGGLQEQVMDMSNLQMSQEYVEKRNDANEDKVKMCGHGIGIIPSSDSVIGSQSVPYIFENRISKTDFLKAMVAFFNMTKEERVAMGKRGREHIEKNYNFDTFCKRWDEVMMSVHEKYGSWDNRKNYKPWELREL